MTVLMLYAVLPADAPDVARGDGPDVPVALDRLDVGPVGVLYEQRDHPPSAERADILSFGEVVQRLASSGPVLPVRFGTTLPDLAGLRQLIEEQGPGWRRRLDAVAGHVEMVVHARDGSTAAVTPASADITGTEYLLSRAAVLRSEKERLESLRAVIEPVASETRVLKGAGELRLACLVRSDRVAALQAAVEGWAVDGEGRHAEATGPWPPFSFTEPEDTP